jgi:LysM repeat protein
MKKRIAALGCVVLLIVLVLIGGAIYYLYLAQPKQLSQVSPQLPTDYESLAVTLVAPQDGTTWPTDVEIPIHAQAVGNKPVASFELWADGALVQTQGAPGEGYAAWNWAFNREGEHILLARAIDADHLVQTSNAVRIHISKNDKIGGVLLNKTNPGDTVASLAGNFKTTPQQIVGLNPTVNPNGPIPPGQIVKIPLPPPPPPPQPAPIANPPASSGPGFGLQVNGCNVVLDITPRSNSATGYYVYRLDPGASTFKRIATLAPATNNAALHYTDSGVFGEFEYYASAFNAGGEAASNISNASVNNPSCQSSYWKGQQWNGSPVSLPPNLDKVYFYSSVNSGPWTRTPADPQSFLQPKKGQLDLNAEILKLFPTPVTSATNVVADVWGWSGSNLIYVGEFNETINPLLKVVGNFPPVNLPQPSKVTELQICTISACAGDIQPWGTQAQTPFYLNWDFEFTPAEQGVTGGVWQVSEAPYSNACDLHPIGLKSSGTIVGTLKLSYFQIDFSSLKPSNGKLPVFYIRIIPKGNGQVICSPSNTVTLTFVQDTSHPLNTPIPPVPGAPAPFTAKIASISPYQYADQNYAHCVVVTNVTAPSLFPYQVGQELCPKAFKGGSPSLIDQGNILATIWNYASSLWDLLSGIYDGFKSDIIKAACTTLPAQAHLNLPSLAVTACQEAVGGAVNAGLEYLGLPPSIPNSQQLVNIAKGDLVALVAQNFEDETGLPCDDSCQALLQQGMDKVIQAIQQSAAQATSCPNIDQAHAEGFEPLCLPSNIQTAPDPKGQVQPFVVNVQVTRNPGVSDNDLKNVNCVLNVDVNGTNNYWVGKAPNLFDKSGNPIPGQQLNGKLFYSLTQPFPRGTQNGTFAIPLQPYSGVSPNWVWLYPGHDPWFDSGGVLPYQRDDWIYLYNGAAATATVNGSCSWTNLQPSQYQIPTSFQGDTRTVQIAPFQ